MIPSRRAIFIYSTIIALKLTVFYCKNNFQYTNYKADYVPSYDSAPFCGGGRSCGEGVLGFYLPRRVAGLCEDGVCGVLIMEMDLAREKADGATGGKGSDMRHGLS